MEEILLSRLSKFASEIKSLSDQAHNLCTILNDSNEHLEPARIVMSKLKTMLSRFTTELYNYFKICNNPNPDEISEFTNDQLQGEENLAELEARLAMRSEKLVVVPAVPQQSDSSSYSKLPDLHLPEFSGNLLEWNQFWDQFTSNMNRRKLNDVDKLLYLKSSLKGDAARLVDGLNITNQIYQIAVDTLKARYGKESDIIYAHHNAMKRIKRAEKMEDCKGTLDEIERHLRVLQSIGENTNSNQMRFLIIEKFPKEIIYEMKMRLDDNKTESVEEILKQLSKVISVKEEARMITEESTKNEASQYTVETLHVKETTFKDRGHSSKMNNANAPNHHKGHWNNLKPRFKNQREKSLPNKRKFEPERNGYDKFSKEKRRKWSCIFYSGGPFKLPPTPALPHERVNYSKPFTFTGIDYLGPVLVKSETGTSKRWICLFICLAVRAVHLEVVEDLSAEESLLALRRMIAARGVPTLITSDNALHFKLIADIVSNAYCVKNKIKWRFIPELEPWFGGFYERLVGLVKHCMRRTLQKHLLKDNQLSTMVKEIEDVINTRPLTSVDSEVEHVLTPADFFQMDKCIGLETAEDNIPLQGTLTKINLVQGWRRARVLLEEFKEMFRNRYLPSLRERYHHSLKQPRVTSTIISKEGQLVQIKGDKNRESLKVGRIISLVKSSDGLTRLAQVKVGDTILTRSIAHLYPLEVEDDYQWEPVPTNFKETNKTQQLPDDVSEESAAKPDNITMDTEDTQKETLTDNDIETRQVDNMDVTENTVDITNNEANIDIESIDKDRVANDLIDDDSNVIDNDLVTPNNDVVKQSEETRHKRIAAVRALDKIREWTRNLLTLL